MKGEIKWLLKYLSNKNRLKNVQHLYADRQIDGQADRSTERQTDRWTGIQIITFYSVIFWYHQFLENARTIVLVTLSSREVFLFSVESKDAYPRFTILTILSRFPPMPFRLKSWRDLRIFLSSSVRDDNFLYIKFVTLHPTAPIGGRTYAWTYADMRPCWVHKETTGRKRRGSEFRTGKWWNRNKMFLKSRDELYFRQMMMVT